MTYASAYYSIGGGASVVVVNGAIIDPVIIGDDYLEANNRHFEFTISAPSGGVVGTSTCKLGFANDCGEGFSVSGSLVDNGDGTWKLKFNIEGDDYGSITEGFYNWTASVYDASGNRISTNRGTKPAYFVSSQTP